MNLLSKQHHSLRSEMFVMLMALEKKDLKSWKEILQKPRQYFFSCFVFGL